MHVQGTQKAVEHRIRDLSSTFRNAINIATKQADFVKTRWESDLLACESNTLFDMSNRKSDLQAYHDACSSGDLTKQLFNFTCSIWKMQIWTDAENQKKITTEKNIFFFASLRHKTTQYKSSCHFISTKKRKGLYFGTAA